MTIARRWRVYVLTGVAISGALYGGVTIAQQRAALAMAGAANAFLASLTPEQRAKAVFALNDAERMRWNFIPTSMFPRNGLPLKEMTEPQRQLAHDLLKASLSQVGYQTATSIMSLEEVLRDMGARGRAASASPLPVPGLAVRQVTAPAAAAEPAAGGGQGGRGGGAAGRGGGIVRDPELYFFSIFGMPSATSGWAMRVEGHHLSMHFAIDGAKTTVVSTPFFMGATPAEVREGPRTGLRALGSQEDTARALVLSLTEAQKGVAIVAQAPGEIVTNITTKVDPLAPAGLAASDMSAEQRAMLMAVIDAFIATQTADVTADRMSKLRAAGLEKIAFLWAGSLEKGQRYHYRIQGPTFLIEHNNTQSNGNHVHSVWRDFNGDFGRDLLAEHLEAVAH